MSWILASCLFFVAGSGTRADSFVNSGLVLQLGLSEFRD